MSDSNLIEIGYVKESTFASTPTTPTLEIARKVSESLGQDPQFTRSAELVATADVQDIIRVGVSAGGGIQSELHFGRAQTSAPYGFPDDFMLGFLRASAFSSVVTTTGSGLLSVESIASSGSGYATVNRGSGSFVSDGWLVGQWGKLTAGFSDTNDGAHFKVVSVAATEMEVLVANADNDFTDETPAGTTTAVQGSQAVNGTTLSHFTIEKRFPDLTTADYEILRGMTVNRMTIDTSTRSIVQIGFDFLGSNAFSGVIAGSSDQAAATNKAYNAVDHVVAIHEGQDVGFATVGLTQLTFGGQNGLRAREEIGLLGAESIGAGTFEAEGRIRGNYKSKTLINKLLAATETQLSIIFTRGGLDYVVECPSVTFTQGRRVAGGQNQDVLNDMQWQAAKHDTEGVSMRITRFF